MGWAGSLVVLIVSIGLPEQGAYQLLPMLPFVLPLFAIWFSRDGEENDGIERRGRKKKKQGSLGRLLYEPSFLTTSSPLSICWRIQWFKMSCFSLANQVNGVLLPAILTITPSRRIPSMLGIRQLLSIKKAIVWPHSALLTPTSYLGINENRTNVIQQIDRSEPKVYCGQQSGGVDLQYEGLAQRKLSSG